MDYIYKMLGIQKPSEESIKEIEEKRQDKKFYSSCVLKEEGDKKRLYAICNLCKKEHRYDYGFEYSYAGSSGCGAGRYNFCSQCSRKAIPIIWDCLDKIDKLEKRCAE